ncbi:hypothetical protein J6590_032623 [Homalodisca vitripennis]|nr:hypothetical protein J6590_032623 [Homalodisca vitripennis]
MSLVSGWRAEGAGADPSQGPPEKVFSPPKAQGSPPPPQSGSKSRAACAKSAVVPSSDREMALKTETATGEKGRECDCMDTPSW